jgi:hypothetical protein
MITTTPRLTILMMIAMTVVGTGGGPITVFTHRAAAKEPQEEKGEEGEEEQQVQDQQEQGDNPPNPT